MVGEIRTAKVKLKILWEFFPSPRVNTNVGMQRQELVEQYEDKTILKMYTKLLNHDLLNLFLYFFLVSNVLPYISV